MARTGVCESREVAFRWTSRSLRGKVGPMGLFAWTSLLAAGAVGLLLTPRQGHPDAAQVDHAESLFKSRCASCHIVPDPSFEADRAYIRQIYDTA